MLKDMKIKILEQEYRFKKLKADRVEGLLESRDTMHDEIVNADRNLEEAMKHIIFKTTQDKEREKEYIEIAKEYFEVWRDFLRILSGTPP